MREPTFPNLYDLQRDLHPLPTRDIHTLSRSASIDRSRQHSTTNFSRPTTPALQVQATVNSEVAGSAEKLTKKRWWSSGKKDTDEDRGPVAWIAGYLQKQVFDVAALVEGQPVQELWNEGGDCYIYLYAKGSSSSGASFKVYSSLFSSSAQLTRMAFDDGESSDGAQRAVPWNVRSASFRNATRGCPPHRVHDMREANLYLPPQLHIRTSSTPTSSKSKASRLTDQVSQLLQERIDLRNLFAFLNGQSLVATEQKSSFFQIFMSIAALLKLYMFSSPDGSTFGEVARSSFDQYVDEIQLSDVRLSREKTIESIILSERMRSVSLYNEAFAHGVGKHDALLASKSPKLDLISGITQSRMHKAAMDLQRRTAGVRLILNDFEFPSLFQGIASSKTSEERRNGVRFEGWKDSFFTTRKFVLSMYQQRYGNWPPKASSKRNDLETSGLNRLVLRDVYDDMTPLYDMLVDRNALTTRTVDGIDRDTTEKEESTIRALRSLLSEYDRSSPPVKPPMPFDLPMLPSLRSTRPDFGTGDKKKDPKALGKKLKDSEIVDILRLSSNSGTTPSPFLDAFVAWQRKQAHSCTIAQLVDQRIGQWLFMYVILQALPMLACDAPGIRWSRGVEYFLCEPPRSGVPWISSSTSLPVPSAGGIYVYHQSVQGGGMLGDVAEHGIEGIYRRSHCWRMAEKWAAANPAMFAALHERHSVRGSTTTQGVSLDPMHSAQVGHRSGRAGETLPSNGQSTLSYQDPRSGYTLQSRHRSEARAQPRPISFHAVDASKTFDAILATADVNGKKRLKQ